MFESCHVNVASICRRGAKTQPDLASRTYHSKSIVTLNSGSKSPAFSSAPRFTKVAQLGKKQP